MLFCKMTTLSLLNILNAGVYPFFMVCYCCQHILISLRHTDRDAGITIIQAYETFMAKRDTIASIHIKQTRSISIHFESFVSLF